jgi:hypothetical protein
MIQITNVTNYEGAFKGEQGTFLIMTDEGDKYVIYHMVPGQPARVESEFIKASLDAPDKFPDAVGKFIEELIMLKKPIAVPKVPSYDEADNALAGYFATFGEDFNKRV